ncbi:MAG: hypothetical protein E7644_01165 [Ruminococcaceae bacterium]|nr:hypothetical protein [Oscillospiraceae bacterium]
MTWTKKREAKPWRNLQSGSAKNPRFCEAKKIPPCPKRTVGDACLRKRCFTFPRKYAIISLKPICGGRAMLTYDHFIFDFDGTLSDSYASFVKAAMMTAGKYGVPADEEQVYYLLKKYSTVYLFDTLPFGPWRDTAYAEFSKLSKEILAEEAEMMTGTVELLEFIRAHGGKSYVYSHSGEIVLKNVARWGIGHFFTDYMLGDKRYPRKPAPDALLELVRRNGLDLSRSVMIGDRDIDVLAGKNAGMASILLDDSGFYPDLEVDARVGSLIDVKHAILCP